jgi:hypothetical protein
MRKAEQILRFIKKSGTKGRRFTDIQRFIFNINKPHLKFDPVHDRGYYCNPLCGAQQHRWLKSDSDGLRSTRTGYEGLLSYCKKNKKGRYTLNVIPRGKLFPNKFTP